MFVEAFGAWCSSLDRCFSADFSSLTAVLLRLNNLSLNLSTLNDSSLSRFSSDDWMARDGYMALEGSILVLLASVVYWRSNMVFTWPSWSSKLAIFLFYCCKVDTLLASSNFDRPLVLGVSWIETRSSRSRLCLTWTLEATDIGSEGNDTFCKPKVFARRLMFA